MKKLVALFLFAANLSFAQQPFYDVTAGNGNGIRLWQDNAYKIHMGSGSEYFFGPVQDYSIKINMSGGFPSRGWTWGVIGQTPVAAINTLGNMQVAGSFTSNVINAVGNSPSQTNLIMSANYPTSYRWRMKTFDRGNAIDMDFTSSDASDAEETIMQLSRSNSTRPEFRILTDWLVANNGYIGLGTQSPPRHLTISGLEGADPSLLVQNKSFNSSQATGTASIQFGFLDHVGPKLEAYKYTTNTTGLKLYTEYGYNNTQLALTIKPTKQIGFNTDNPLEALQIGDIGGNVNKIAIPGVYNFENLKIGQFGNGAAGLELVNHSNLTDSYGIRLLTNVDQAYGFQLQYAPSANNYNNLQYVTGIFMGVNGYVGIGTTTPDAKLSVKGQVHAQEVKVDLNGAVAPDYVFEPEYNLSPLDSIKTYIDKNKHLPEVPSAKDMEKNGVNLGEMNMLLLKKIEELTMYVIEQQKEIKGLKEAIKK